MLYKFKLGIQTKTNYSLQVYLNILRKECNSRSEANTYILDSTNFNHIGIFKILIYRDDYNKFYQRMIEVPDNDLEYYERKVMRMQQDINLLQEELSRTRVRLRAAEDYQIKYQIIMKNFEAELLKAKIQSGKIEEERGKQKIVQSLKENDERWTQAKQASQDQLKQEFEEKTKILREELQSASTKIKQLLQKKEEMQIFSFKIRKYEKQNEALQLQLNQIKNNLQKQKNEQIMALRAQLNTSFRQKLKHERESTESRINLLTKRLAQAQNQQYQQIRFPESGNSELRSLKELFDQTKADHMRQINQLQEIILRKNEEIKTLIRNQTENQRLFQDHLQQKNKVIKDRQNLITTLRKQNEEEAIQLNHKNLQAKEAEIKVLKEQINEHISQIRQKQKQIKQQQRRQNDEIKQLSNDYKNKQQKIMSTLDENRKIIDELTSKFVKKEPENGSKSRYHPSSINDYDEKQQFAHIQHNSQFLQNQLRRAEQKTQQIQRLYEKLQDQYKDSIEQFQKNIQAKDAQIKKQREQNRQKINKLQDNIRLLVDQLVSKNVEFIGLKKASLSQKHFLERELRTLKANLGQLQGEINALTQAKRNLQQQLQSKLSVPSFNSKAAHNISSYQDDIDAVMRQKQEGLLRKYSNHQALLQDQVNLLKQNLRNSEQQNITLQRQYNSILKQLQMDKQSDKTIQQKKLASLDLEVALLNNVYSSLIALRQGPSQLHRIVSYEVRE